MSEREHCEAVARAWLREDDLGFVSAHVSLIALLIRERQAARAEGYQAGVRDAEGMAEVHRNRFEVARSVADYLNEVHTAYDVEDVGLVACEDILHDIRTLKEAK